MPQDADLIALRELPGVGERTTSRLVELARTRGESLRDVLRASPRRLEKVYGLPPQAVGRLRLQPERHLERCRWIGSELRRAGGYLMTPESAPYPIKLRESLRHPPPMLFGLGNRSILDRPCIAVLSSREIGEQTVAATIAVVGAAKGHRVATAIGGMKSTHRIAAISARAGGAKRIVVLDRGLFAAFASDFNTDPFGCGSDRAQLDRHSTLVLSSFRPEDHAAPNSGRRRDEIIAALGDIIFAGTARPGGETERICLAALARGKPVVVWHRGANRELQRAGARTADRASLAELIRRLRESPRTAVPPADRSPDRPRPPHKGRKPRSREG